MQPGATAIAVFAASVMVRFAHAEEPPRPAVDPEEAVLRCYGIHGRNGTLTGSVDVTVTVDAAGRATGVVTPPGTEERLAAAAQCVGVSLRYQPALENDLAVPGTFKMTVPFPSVPSFKYPLRNAIDYCHAPWALNDVYEGTVDVMMRVGGDGRVKEHMLPGGTLPWMTEAAKCVADRVEFFPASWRAKTVDAWVIVPLEFQLTTNKHLDAEIIAPTVRSKEAIIVDAYRRCYPEGRTDSAQIHYRITITEGGRVRKVELIGESTDKAMEDAGICILRSISFIAARRNGRAVESTLNWPVLVRPPG